MPRRFFAFQSRFGRYGRRLLALCLALCHSWSLSVQAQEVSEYGMKAVLFYRLAQFVYWPADEKAPNPLVLCVVGRNVSFF